MDQIVNYGNLFQTSSYDKNALHKNFRIYTLSNLYGKRYLRRNRAPSLAEANLQLPVMDRHFP